MSLEISIEDDRWLSVALPDLASRATDAVLTHLGHDPEVCEISLLACDDARIAGLNAEFRGKPVPTNVLSWPGADLSAQVPGQAPTPPAPDLTGELQLGDIAISFDTCHREAEAAGKKMAHHVLHLVVHGVLHLLGYDHVRDPDATLMERLEADILGKLGVDDPYYGTT